MPAGSGGGGGGNGYQGGRSGGAGGAGGGTVYIESLTTLSITATGEIDADGGRGGDGRIDGAGGGGGSGGAIHLRAAAIEKDGDVHARGGAGGTVSRDGGDGGNGRIRVDADTLMVNGQEVTDATELLAYAASTSPIGLLSRQDYDWDGLSNLEEIEEGTRSYLQDTDGDGIKDGVEVDNGLDPMDGADAEEDPD